MDRYEEALERAKDIYNAPVATIVTRTFLEQVFPELKESEDERIRKELWEYFHDLQLSSDCDFSPSFTIDDILAYLEKRKVNTDGDFARGFDCGYECCLNSHGAEWFEKQKEQKPAARENDFVSKPQTSVEILRHYLVWAGNSESEEDCPYTWRALADAIRDGIKALEEQKPAEWSEEDEKMLTGIIERGSSQVPFGEPALREEQMEWLMNMLKSLRPQPHWKPSEEQMQYLLAVINDPNNAGAESCHLILESLYNNLKKL